MDGHTSEGRIASVYRAANKLAASQFGLISRDQAIALGMSSSAISRRVRSGAWVRDLPGVFRLSGSPSSWQQRVVASVLWVGDEGVASHRTAGALLKLEGIAAGSIEVTATRHTWQPKGIKVHYTRRLAGADISRIGPIRLTSPTRTGRSCLSGFIGRA